MIRFLLFLVVDSFVCRMLEKFFQKKKIDLFVVNFC